MNLNWMQPKAGRSIGCAASKDGPSGRSRALCVGSVPRQSSSRIGPGRKEELVVAFCIGALDKEFGIATDEMHARHWPTIVDLATAFVAGLASAYASGRPGLLAALPRCRDRRIASAPDRRDRPRCVVGGVQPLPRGNTPVRWQCTRDRVGLGRRSRTRSPLPIPMGFRSRRRRPSRPRRCRGARR